MAWPETLQLGLIALALIAVLSILIGSLRAGISPMPSSRKAHQSVFAMMEENKNFNKGQGLTLIDCGSGWGHLVFQLARRYPEANIVGYELSIIPWLTSNLLARFLLISNLTIYRGNFLGTDLPVPLSQGDYLFTFLSTGGMQKLAKWFQDAPENSKPIHRPDTQHLISIFFALPGYRYNTLKQLPDLYRTPVYLYQIHRSPADSIRQEAQV